MWSGVSPGTRVQSSRRSLDPEWGGDDQTTGTRFNGDAHVDIPDNNDDGITSTVVVPDDQAEVGELRVVINLRHTYIGDLQIVLEHGDRAVTLRNRSGGSTNDLTIDTQIDDFAGARAGGEWVLRVIDHAAAS